MSASIPVLVECADLLLRYDALICDIWGVVHDGRRAYAPAAVALKRFRERGGTVVLLSNSPMPSSAVVRVLDEKGVERDIADAIVTSGDITRQILRDRGHRRVHHIGPPRDLVLFDGTGLARVSLGDAEAIVCTGLVDDINETAESYQEILREAQARGLPFLCANPDLVVDVGGVLLPCAGTLAAAYEEIGGTVVWAGKPWPLAYDAALARLAHARGRDVPRERVLAIGDAMRTDIAGAARAGFHALFIGQGIHRDEVIVGGQIDQDRFATLVAQSPADVAAALRGAAVGLVW
jgi:HAD superfamily hydrolase (TIGR01459 family)